MLSLMHLKSFRYRRIPVFEKLVRIRYTDIHAKHTRLLYFEPKFYLLMGKHDFRNLGDCRHPSHVRYNKKKYKILRYYKKYVFTAKIFKIKLLLIYSKFRKIYVSTVKFRYLNNIQIFILIKTRYLFTLKILIFRSNSFFRITWRWNGSTT